MKNETLERSIGLPGAVFLIVGFVVGASIFILPGSLAANTGPAVFIAYMLAAIPALLACFAMAQIGSAVPSSGSIYLVIREVLAPSLGFLYLWLMVAMAAVVIPLVALGFADYAGHFIPGLNRTVMAMSVTVFFIAANYFGMKTASGMQNIMVIFFMLVLLVFGLGGLANAEAALLQPLFPRGLSPVVLATITAYFSYTGVFVIAEVAGEIRNPGHTIPLAIFLSFIVIVLLYAVVPLALTGILPWQTLGSSQMAVVTAAEQFMPAWLVMLVAAGALFAAATSINGVIMGLSRDFYKGARTSLFPGYFGVIHERFKTPGRAILAIGALSLVGIYAGGSVIQYAQIAVMGLLLIQIMTGIALYNLPTTMPEAYAASPFKLGPVVLRVLSVCYVIVSAVFLFIMGADQNEAVVGGAVFIALGFCWYLVASRLRK